MWINIEQAKARYKKSRQYLDKVFNNGNALRRKTKEHGIQYDQDTFDSFFGFSDGSVKEVQKVEPDKKDDQTNITGNTTTLTKVNIALKVEKVRAQKLKNKKEAEKSVDREQTEDLFFMIARNTRDAFESIPSRAATICVGKTRHEIEQILTEEIKQSLSNLVLNL